MESLKMVKVARESNDACCISHSATNEAKYVCTSARPCKQSRLLNQRTWRASAPAWQKVADMDIADES